MQPLMVCTVGKQHLQGGMAAFSERVRHYIPFETRFSLIKGKWYKIHGNVVYLFHFKD